MHGHVLAPHHHTHPSPPLPPACQVFAKGVGTQVMHKKQRMGQTSARHMMLELARTLLAHNEWKTFSYYLDQYESEKIGVEDFVVALLRLLNTDEKVSQS